MAISSERLRFFCQIVLSLITASAIIKFIAWYRGEIIYNWSFEDYNYDNLPQFYHLMLAKYLIYTTASWLFFYFGLRVIVALLLQKRLRKWFFEIFEETRKDERSYDKFIKALFLGCKIRQAIIPSKPFIELKISKDNRDKEIDYLLYHAFNKLSLVIHMLFCALFLNVAHKAIFVFIIGVVFIFMIVFIPYTKALIDHIDNWGRTSHHVN